MLDDAGRPYKPCGPFPKAFKVHAGRRDLFALHRRVNHASCVIWSPELVLVIVFGLLAAYMVLRFTVGNAAWTFFIPTVSMCIPVVLIWIMSGIRRRRTSQMRRLLLLHGICPQCGESLGSERPDADGHVCAKCMACWDVAAIRGYVRPISESLVTFDGKPGRLNEISPSWSFLDDCRDPVQLAGLGAILEELRSARSAPHRRALFSAKRELERLGLRTPAQPRRTQALIVVAGLILMTVAMILGLVLIVAGSPHARQMGMLATMLTTILMILASLIFTFGSGIQGEVLPRRSLRAVFLARSLCPGCLASLDEVERNGDFVTCSRCIARWRASAVGASPDREPPRGFVARLRMRIREAGHSERLVRDARGIIKSQASPKLATQRAEDACTAWPSPGADEAVKRVQRLGRVWRWLTVIVMIGIMPTVILAVPRSGNLPAQSWTEVGILCLVMTLFMLVLYAFAKVILSSTFGAGTGRIQREWLAAGLCPCCLDALPEADPEGLRACTLCDGVWKAVPRQA